jgi:hypothetical protein
MNYYLAKVRVGKIQFDALVKAETFSKAEKIADKNYPLKKGYMVNVKPTLE